MAVFVAFLISGTLVAALLTWLIRDVANRYGLAFGPSSARHLHISPIPRLGGVAIFATFFILFAIYYFAGIHGWVAQPLNHDVFKVLLPGAGLFVVGLFDDLRGLSAKLKLLAQSSAGLCLYFSGLHFACFHSPAVPAWMNSGICMLTTVFWVVLVCNAINLIDGLDGLASGAALFSMITIVTMAMVEGRTGVAVVTAVLAGSMLGFLFFNFNPASIFLGDSGSLFVGFMLSGFVLAEAQKQQTVTDSFAIPFISLAVPLTDTALSVLRRFLSGHSLFGADKEHIHHKLLELGLTQRQAVWILYGVSAGCAVLSLSLLHPSNLMLLPVAGVLLLVLFFGLRKLRYHEFAEFQRIWKRIGQQRRVFARDIAVRKTAAELETVRDFNRVLSLLERCLKSDFDGFEILLNTDIFGQSKEYSPWNRPIKRLWKNGYDGKMVFTSDLSTPTHGLVGTISLHRPIVGGWLMDTDLLAGSLHKSLGIAVENCILGAAKPLFVVRTLETIPNQSIVDPDSQFRIFQEDPLPSGHRLAGASSGND